MALEQRIIEDQNKNRVFYCINSLAPNDVYISRTAQLTSPTLHFKYLLNNYTY